MKFDTLNLAVSKQVWGFKKFKKILTFLQCSVWSHKMWKNFEKYKIALRHKVVLLPSSESVSPFSTSMDWNLIIQFSFHPSKYPSGKGKRLAFSTVSLHASLHNLSCSAEGSNHHFLWHLPVLPLSCWSASSYFSPPYLPCPPTYALPGSCDPHTHPSEQFTHE